MQGCSGDRLIQFVYLGVHELAPLWEQVELDAIDGSWQCDTPNHQNRHEDVGRGGREVHHLITQETPCREAHDSGTRANQDQIAD